MDVKDYIKYPRPQFRRNEFLILDGEWKLDSRLVRVPYPPQSVLSGYIGDVPDEFTYSKVFRIPDSFLKDKILLHFGAVDQCCTVKVNGIKVGEHCGGYTAFTLDITNAVSREEDNLLTVEVKDSLSTEYSYGKQTKKPQGMWYTPVSGIWQSVWIENVPANYIANVKITPKLDRINLQIESTFEFLQMIIDIKMPDGTLLHQEIEQSDSEIIIPNPVNWTAQNPYLYEFSLKADEDLVEGYFALRTIVIKDVNGIKRVVLNDEPVFLHGVLDQGYFKDGIYTPNDAKDYVRDILNMKELGFNTLRKHIKIEPEQFYFACDVLGMLVIQDMVNSGDYSFVRDTLLPTVGINKKRRTHLSKNHPRRIAFENHMKEVTAQLYNHPCIVVYTIFNEGWGQFDADEMYDYLKTLDDTRLIDSASGWYIADKTDFDSPHIYFRNVKLKPKDKPMLLSECGGYKFLVKEHFDHHKEYGYGSCKDSADLTNRIEKMYDLMVAPAINKGLCGCIYTQLSDVEGEINGLYTYDREMCKVDKNRMCTIAKKLRVTV